MQLISAPDPFVLMTSIIWVHPSSAFFEVGFTLLSPLSRYTFSIDNGPVIEHFISSFSSFWFGISYKRCVCFCVALLARCITIVYIQSRELCANSFFFAQSSTVNYARSNSIQFVEITFHFACAFLIVYDFPLAQFTLPRRLDASRGPTASQTYTRI